MFKTILGNRTLSKSNLRKITRSIAHKNMLSVVPIIVNSNMEVIDGQHRLQIAKENGWPINYVVLEDGSLADVQALNNVAKKWGPVDYIKSYAIQGNKHYVKFLEFLNETELLPGIAIFFLKGSGGGTWAQTIKNGNLTLSDEEIERGYYIKGKFDEILSHTEGVVGRVEYLIRAVIKVIEGGYIDPLIEALQKRDVKIKHQVSPGEYLREFENVLNWRVSKTENFVRLF